jgi:hypothetical protein
VRPRGRGVEGPVRIFLESPQSFKAVHRPIASGSGPIDNEQSDRGDPLEDSPVSLFPRRFNLFNFEQSVRLEGNVPEPERERETERDRRESAERWRS